MLFSLRGADPWIFIINDADSIVPFIGREVYVFGTFDGDKSVTYTDPVVRLSVSYDDPGMS